MVCHRKTLNILYPAFLWEPNFVITHSYRWLSGSYEGRSIISHILKRNTAHIYNHPSNDFGQISSKLDKYYGDYAPKISFVKSALLNFFMVTLAWVTMNVLYAHLRLRQPKQLKNLRYGLGRMGIKRVQDCGSHKYITPLGAINSN